LKQKGGLTRLISVEDSRLSAVRLAESHGACDVPCLEAFNEDHLCSNLAWLSEQQEVIEKRLFRLHYGEATPQLFLYDVTSSYLEGIENELGDFGVEKVTLVRDRGMLKQAQGELLNKESFHYITAITKPQIKALLREGVFQMELFAVQGFNTGGSEPFAPLRVVTWSFARPLCEKKKVPAAMYLW